MEPTPKSIIATRGHLASKILSSIKKRMPVVLVGRPGVGKTSFARSVFDVVGIDAFLVDGSSRNVIKAIPLSNRSIDGKRVGIIVDDADRATGENIAFLTRNLIKVDGDRSESILPVIFTGNDENAFRKNGLHGACDVHEMEPLDPMDIQEILHSIDPGVSHERAREISIACKGNLCLAVGALRGGSVEIVTKQDLKTLARTYLGMGTHGKSKILDDQRVGESDGVYLPYFISLVSRNVTEKEDFILLAQASKLFKKVDNSVVKSVLSLVSEERTKYVKFPRKKKNETVTV